MHHHPTELTVQPHPTHQGGAEQQENEVPIGAQRTDDINHVTWGDVYCIKQRSSAYCNET